MRWHLAGGLALIAASLGLPWWSAERTARAEQRAGQIVDALLASGIAGSRDGAPDPEHVIARTLRAAFAQGVFVTDLEPIAVTDGAWLALANKHYAFRLAPIPVDAADRPAPGATPGCEALAWPLAAAGPAHAMFYAPEDGSRAYTRNLAHGHHGLDDRRPAVGSGRRKATAALDSRRHYRSSGDERWILY